MKTKKITRGTVIECVYYLDVVGSLHVMGKSEMKKEAVFLDVNLSSLNKTLSEIASSSRRNVHECFQHKKCKGMYVSDMGCLVCTSKKVVRQIDDDMQPAYDRLTSFGSAREEMRSVAHIVRMTNNWKAKSQTANAKMVCRRQCLLRRKCGLWANKIRKMLHRTCAVYS